ncbi:Down syndrome cell adhesion molecule homolog isoform X1 [Dermacentor silvarum]|uniref:Down syndrome cell adhesion molecule homolog isoform X1 n=1 Tax=Dermacentor silvarum TaxID=543639 RepID=UPI001899F514|nr:Down syndrome cell adhesion molecule homolog isoform X1 [Dermacentor silvarum]
MRWLVRRKQTAYAPAGGPLFWACVVCYVVCCVLGVASASDPPKVQPFQFPSRPQLGKRLRITCSVTQGDSPLSFAWLKDDAELTAPSSSSSAEGADDHPVSLDAGPESSVLVLKRLGVDDIGNYTCVVSNAAGTDKFQAFLRFPVPPFWKREPEPAEALQGERAILSCEAGGYPEPQVTWKRRHADGAERPVVKSDRVRVTENGSLLLEPVLVSDRGWYACQAHNGVPPDVHRSVALKVRAPPTINVNAKVVTVRRGETATLVCNVTGDQPITVTWTRNGKSDPLVEMAGRELYQVPSEEWVASTLVLKEVDGLAAASYTCTAANEHGTDRAEFAVNVLFPPPTPHSLKTTEIGTRFAHIEWSHSSSNVTRYVVRHWKLTGVDKVLFEHTVPGAFHSALLMNLRPGSQYKAFVVAENAVGQSPQSNAVIFNTAEEAPEASPTDVDCEPVNASSIELSWKSPPDDQWNGAAKGFYVGLKQADHGTPYVYEMVPFGSAGDEVLHRVFTRLASATVYSFVVRAFNSAGSGPATRELRCTTLLGDPPPAPTLYLVKTEESMVTLSWKIPKVHNATVLQYVLETRRDYTDEVSLQHFPSTTDVATVSNLESSVKYSFRLAAYNRYGRGAFSNPITESTRLKFTNRLLSGNLQQPESPFYMRSYFFIVIIACVTLVTLSAVISWACVKRAIIAQERRNKAAAASLRCRPSLSGAYSPRWVHDPRVFDDNYDMPWDNADPQRTASPHAYTNVYHPSSRS